MDRDTARILFYLGEFVLVFGIVVVLFLFRRKGRNRLAASWQAFALRRGFSFTREKPLDVMTLAGTFEGVPVTIRLVRTGTRGLASDPVFEAPLSVFWPEGLEVHSRRCGWPYAYHAPRTGDPEVEKHMVFRAPDPRAVPWLLANPAVREALLVFFAGEGKTRRIVRARGASIQERPMVSDPALLTAQLEALAAFVRAVNAAGAPDRR
ncbi:MAG: hypothetical protein KA419_11570 [Acidobacteria bacterium]|nr:hypothetical protein [Acidobacteriota bacterium]